MHTTGMAEKGAPDGLVPRTEPEVDPHATVQAASAVATLGDGLGMAGRIGRKWRHNVATRQLKNLDYQAQLDQLCDAWGRADRTNSDGLDTVELAHAFRAHFPPWRKPVDQKISSTTLENLFMRVDASGDGRVSWSEFSDFVLSEAMQSHTVDKIEVSIFATTKYDDEYNKPGDYHKDMITGMVLLPNINKYVTTSRDGSFRVWTSNTHKHVQTVKLSEKGAVSWVVGATEALGFKPSTYPFGVLATVSSDRNMRLYDIKSFAFLSCVPLGDDVSPLCCSGFVRKDVLLRMKATEAENFIVIGDAEGKILVYEQVSV